MNPAQRVKTTLIMISAGRTSGKYHSVDDVPGQLRQRLIQTTRGPEAETFIIADRQGREEIAKVLRRLPNEGAGEQVFTIPRSVLRWIGAGLSAMAGASIWWVFSR